jgi:hypothetical protein
MQDFQPLRTLRPQSGFKAGDVLVIFGEVFARGYVNGLIDEATRHGMKVIYGTVGRRDPDGALRALTSEELKEKGTADLINIPLECGFDLQPSNKGQSPCDQLKGLKLSEWNQAKLDWTQIEESRRLGCEGFRLRVKEYLGELEKHIPPGSNVLFAHTMAGGVPRAKIVMPAMNRVFKGHGERFASSQEFWAGEMGRLCAQSFMDVTANSLSDLIDLSQPLRQRLEARGNKAAYVAYGYHGTEILIGGEYKWQSYAPYLQGFAKLELERIATKACAEGVSACVFNAPEILTNSSSIFLGVEVALYPLLGAFQRERANSPLTKELMSTCQSLLKDEHTLEEVLAVTGQYFTSELITRRWSDYPAWPQHNGPDHMEQMRTTSERILSMHKDEKNLLTARLSEIVFQACGKAMLREALQPSQPVWWIGHDLVAKLS